MTALKKTTCLASIAIAFLWLSIVVTNFCSHDAPGLYATDFFDRQQSIFYHAGYDIFNDYSTPRNCAESKNPYMPDKKYALDRKDACYPALALMIVKLFPQHFFVGGALFTLVNVSLWVFSLLPFFAGMARKFQLLVFSTILCSQIFIYSVERGNIIFLAVASLNIFLAWYDNDSPFKRRVAAIALALATVLKISPVLMGLLYLRKKQALRA